MPKGIPAAGFRMTKNRQNGIAPVKTTFNKEAIKDMVAVIPVIKETDAEIDARISERFEILNYLANSAVKGTIKSLIVSGPPGLGKSYTVEKAVKDYDRRGTNSLFISGFIRPSSLFKALWKCSAKGQILVIDDTDSVFGDETSLNLLKKACDTGGDRMISYMTETAMIDEDTATRIPKRFKFEGSVIFITNLDFDAMIEKGSKLAPHLEALVSRSHYVDLGMKTKRDYMVRIRQGVKKLKMLNHLSFFNQDAVMAFIEANQDNLRELSFRMVIKIADLCQTSSNWEKLARVTCFKK